MFKPILIVLFGPLSAVLLSTLVSCQTPTMEQSPDAVGGSRIHPPASYEEQIDRFSDGQAEYNSWYNNFAYRATILNSLVRSESLDKQSRDYQWDHARLVTETQKSDKEAEASTVYFLSFYTPDRHNDNLAESKTIWKIYLDVGGQRYEGHARKMHQLISEIQAIYPYQSRWNTPYYVTFAIPTATVQAQASSITITGPLGARTTHFSALTEK